MKPSVFIVLALLITTSGCSILGNLDGLMTLGRYSREKDAQHKIVKSTDAHYDALVRAIDQGSIKNYKYQLDYIHAFGDPILKKDMGDGQQRWLYRYAIARFARTKVYIYFDRRGQMIKWEKLPCPKLF